MDKKRLIAITIFLVVSIVLGYALYRFFFREPVDESPLPSGGTTGTPLGGELPQSGEGAPIVGGQQRDDLPTSGATQPQGAARRVNPLPAETHIVREDIVGANASKNGVNFYNQTDGKFYRVGADGQLRVLSDEVFFDVQNVTWSPIRDESIIEYPDGSNIYYNFETKRQVTLPKHWESFSFAGQGDRIAAKSIGFSVENQWLVSANPDGNNMTLIAPLGQNADKVMVDWSPNNQIVGMSLTGDALGDDRQEVLFVGLNGENFKSTIVEGRGLQSQWSTDGKKLLYSVYSARNNFKPELWIVNAEGDSIGSGRRLLSVETWASKCAFADAKTAYCGVPTELPEGAGFAPRIADGIPDRLIRIDTQTGTRTEIPLDATHTIENISIAPDGKTLYFTDKSDDGIFRVDL